MRLSQLSEPITEGWKSNIAIGALGIPLGLLGGSYLNKYQQESEKSKEIPPKPQEIVKKETPKPSVSVSEYSEFTAQWEGSGKPGRPGYIYRDSLGNSTIGYGYLLGSSTGFYPDRLKKLSEIGVSDIREVLKGNKPLTKDQMLILLDMEVSKSLSRVKRDFSNFDSLPEIIQKILVDMEYQLGSIKAKMPKSYKAILSNNFSEAAKEAKDSRWFKQSGDRSKHHVDVFS